MSDPFCTDPWFMKAIYRLGEGFAPPGGSGYFGQWAIIHNVCSMDREGKFQSVSGLVYLMTALQFV